MLQENPVEIKCPAKVNLSLAVLGRRSDGFHKLHSVVARTEFGDSLKLQWRAEGAPSNDRVRVDGREVPGGENSVAQALRLFRESTGFDQGSFTALLHKEIPVGAGLGGGSSDAVGTLKALRELSGDSFKDLDWSGIAAQIGSDCPLFFSDVPVLMEGRGELISPLEKSLYERFRGKPVILFKPPFSINTAEAYHRLAKGQFYQTEHLVKDQFRSWREGQDPLPPPHNDFERLVEHWIPSLAVVLRDLRTGFGLDARLSGSGSACFIFPHQTTFAIDDAMHSISSAFGEGCWIEQTVLN